MRRLLLVVVVAAMLLVGGILPALATHETGDEKEDPIIHSVVGTRALTSMKSGGSTGAIGLTGAGNSSSGRTSLTTLR